MLLISVGTGASANANSNLSPEEMNLLYNAGTIPSALMAAALYEQDFLCRIFGKCLAGDLLDREIGSVIGQGIPNVPKLFTYARYNAELSREGLDALGLEQLDVEVHLYFPSHVLMIVSASGRRATAGPRGRGCRSAAS